MRAGTHAPSGSPKKSRLPHRPLQLAPAQPSCYTPGLGAPLCTHLPKVFPDLSSTVKCALPPRGTDGFRALLRGAELRGRAFDCRARPPGGRLGTRMASALLKLSLGAGGCSLPGAPPGWG